MTANPFINALAATIYIVVVVSFIFFGTNTIENETFLIPIAMLSLFTLSAAVMGYIFCLKPLELFLEGNKKEGVELFLKTVGIFAVITICFFIVTIIYSYF